MTVSTDPLLLRLGPLAGPRDGLGLAAAPTGGVWLPGRVPGARPGVIAIWNGAPPIVGAVLGGTLAGAVAARTHGLPVRALSDAVAPAVALGQAIGRPGGLGAGGAGGAPAAGLRG